MKKHICTYQLNSALFHQPVGDAQRKHHGDMHVGGLLENSVWFDM